MFGMNHLEWDTSSIAPQLPIFEELLGEDIPLKLTLHWKDINVLLGQYDSDIIIEYTACMDWKTDLLGSRQFLYNELRFITTVDLKMENDQLYFHILNHHLDLSFEGPSLEPIRTSLEDFDNEEFIR